MIDTVLFDMGGTLEDIFTDDESREQSAREVLRILKEKGIAVSDDLATPCPWTSLPPSRLLPAAGTATPPTGAPQTGS